MRWVFLLDLLTTVVISAVVKTSELEITILDLLDSPRFGPPSERWGWRLVEGSSQVERVHWITVITPRFIRKPSCLVNW